MRCKDAKLASLVLPLAHLQYSNKSERKSCDFLQSNSQLYRPKKKICRAQKKSPLKCVQSRLHKEVKNDDIKEKKGENNLTCQRHASVPIVKCGEMKFDIYSNKQIPAHDQTEEIQHLVGELRTILASDSLSDKDNLQSQRSIINFVSKAVDHF